MDNEYQLTVFNILEKTGFYSKTQKKGLPSARMKDILYILPKTIAKIQNPPSLAIETVEDSYE